MNQPSAVKPQPSRLGSWPERSHSLRQQPVNICHVHPEAVWAPHDWEKILHRIASLGFSHVCIGASSRGSGFGRRLAGCDIADVAAAAERAQVSILLDFSPALASAESDAHPPREAALATLSVPEHRDPRQLSSARPESHSHPKAAAAEDAGAWWGEQLAFLTDAGVQGFRCLDLSSVPIGFWQRLREALPDSLLLAWTSSISSSGVGSLASVGFDCACISDASPRGRAAWLLELAALSSVGNVVIIPEPAPQSASESAPESAPGAGMEAGLPAALRFAASVSAGLFVPLTPRPQDDGHGGTTFGFDRQQAERVRDAVAFGKTLPPPTLIRLLSAPDDPVLVFLRSDRAIVRDADQVVLIAVNTDLAARHDVRSQLNAYAVTDVALVPEIDEAFVEAGDLRVIRCRRAAPATTSPGTLLDRTPSPRIVIETVRPSMPDRTTAIKTIAGRDITVTADIFTEGHGMIAADLLWRSADETGWRRVPMVHTGNDVWTAGFRSNRIGLCQFAIEAWPNSWATFAHGLEAKHNAGVDTSLELTEGRTAIHEADALTNGRLAAWREAELGDLLSHELADLMRSHGRRGFVTRSETIPVRVDRPRAEFGSWYELFPRSETDDPKRHGTFRSVIGRLPAIRDMGFDVLYFPPIHPIGAVNRKGRNNSLKALSGDVGSPYAIGGQEGGHDAVHPDLGTIEDFEDLVAASRAHGLEIALDFAAQCAPDHPWVRQHPEWFQRRPDGSIRYAENPPKKYEDIVNPEFYGEAPFPAVWHAIRDVFLFWVERGVRIFRVDNPHTKPIPFWQWLISSLQDAYPDLIFLAEAFTRPKVMYGLAKVGFSQSYTYFTWRNSKDEIMEYMRELVSSPASDIFRPNFFVNTPDINPYYLQQHGRPGFLVRAFLATTLAASWGMYSGFEICEYAPLPGREEYLDSEKYEVRPRDFSQEGNIVGEITQLNRIRRLFPALQSHNRLEFYETSHPDVLAYGKRDPGGNGMVLMAVTLRPDVPAAVRFGLPAGLRPDAGGAVSAHDLWSGTRSTWWDMSETIDFGPGLVPFRIWQVTA